MGLTAGMGMGELVAVGVGGAGLAGVDDDINWAAGLGTPETAATGAPWSGMFNQVWGTVSKILVNQYGQPAPGTVITTPNGQYIRQANGVPVPVVSATVGTTGGGLGTGTLVLLLVGVVTVVAMKGK